MANNFEGWNIAVNTVAASFTSNEIIVPSGGMNILIAGMTGGSVFVEEQIDGAYVQTADNTFTADCSRFLPLCPGRKVRLTGDSLTTATSISVRLDPSSASANYDTLVEIIADNAALDRNVRDTATIDMLNDDYTLTELQAQCSVILVTNPGDGSKILTFPALDSAPEKYSVYVFGAAPVQLAYTGEPHVCAAFQLVVSNTVHIEGIGMYSTDNMAVVISNPGGTTTAGNMSEQVIEQCIIPADCWENDGSLTINFSGLKSNTATTETVNIRIGDQGDTSDTIVWANSTNWATTNVGFSMSVTIQKISDTVVRVVSTRNAINPFATSTSASSFTDVTVDNMANNPTYISVTGTNSTGGETVTSKYFRGVLSR